MNTSEHDQHNRPDKQDPSSDDTPMGTGEDAHLLAYQRRNARILWIILAVLLMLAAGVFFVLPDYVDRPDPARNADSGSSSRPAPSRPAEEDESISPFEEAQLMRQRETAQETLGQLLELQESLEEQGVEQWAGDSYDEALSLAQSGDNAYREQDFVTAGEHYRESLATLQALEADLPRAVQAQLETGLQAIRDGEPEAARAAFELAMVMAPDNVEADAGLRRAQVLDEVLMLNEEADSLRENGELEAARELYREALALDSEHEATREKLAALESDIEDRNFTRFMSQGYGALAGNEPEQAEDFFEQALAVRPGSGEASAALEQVRDQMTSNAISRHLEAARAHEAEEEWQQALDAYQQALEVDANVVAAEEGARRARSRRNLDDFLSRLLEDPLRLADEADYTESRDIYLNALRIPEAQAGPRLRQQLEQVEHYLEQARIPREVTLHSDDMTQVTVLRVQRLGAFSETTLPLTPGRYVATGTRTGYRDVRREFVVPFEEAPPEVTVICEDRIR